MDIIQLHGNVTPRNINSPVAAGERIAKKFVDAHAWAQASLAAAKDEQEKQANRHRDPAPAYKPGDKVWLNLRNWKTDRPSKKLDARSALYTVQAPVGSHAYRLDTPPGVHPVFHTWLLQPAANDPLPSQRIPHYEPPAVLVPDDDGSPHKEWGVEKILDERQRGPRHKRYTQVLVKWTGYHQPSWEPRESLEDAEALDRFDLSRGQPID